jgi:tetratricopeptide (TPR) repeat protein
MVTVMGGGVAIPARYLDSVLVVRRSASKAADEPWNGVREAGSVSVAASSLDCAESFLTTGIRLLVDDGDLRGSRHWFDRAYRMAEQAGDPHVMAEAALGLGGLWVHEHRTAAAAAVLEARLRQALSLVEPQSSLALRLRARLAGEADYRGAEHAAILAVLDEARRAADPVARAEALSLAHHCLLGPDHGALRRDLAVELLGACARTQRRSDLLMGLLWQTVDQLLDGDRHAERRLAELRDQLAAEDHLAVGFVADAIDVMLAIRADRLGDAEAMAQACAERGTAAGDVDAAGWYGAQLVAIRWYQGRLVELLPMLHDLVHSPTLSVVDNAYFAALAVAAAMAGDESTAAGAVARLRGDELADLPRSSTWLVTMHGIIEAANLLGDADTSARAYELLEPFAHRPVMASLGVACFGSVHHALGVASLTIGQVDRATDHFREAINRNLALGHWPAARISRLRYAHARSRRGPSRDHAIRRHGSGAADPVAAMGPEPTEPTGPTGPTGPAGRAVTCTREGRQWRIGFGSRSVLVEHSIGMLHLAVLLANPGTDIPSIELASGAAALGNREALASVSAQPALDRTAMQQYRQRLSRLRAEIDVLEASDDGDRAARARAERDWLMAELSAATGLGGRARRIPDSAERARLAVGKAIRRAIARIDQSDPPIGDHLRRAVHTGMRCSYQPG